MPRTGFAPSKKVRYLTGAYSTNWSNLSLPAYDNGTIVIVHNSDDAFNSDRIYFRSGGRWKVLVT